MPSRSKILLLSLSIFLLLVSITMALHGKNQGDSTAPNKEEATSVQEGVMTAKEVVHSKIYKKEYEWRKGQKLSNLRGTGEAQVIVAPPSVPSAPNLPPLTINSFLRIRWCDADAVVIGVVKSKSSQLTEDETFTFTQYEMNVEEVIKNNATAPIAPNSNIDITRPGGAILLHGRIIRAIDLSFPPLKVGGHYLLFLRSIPATGAYKAFSRQGDFQLENNSFTPLTRELLPNDLQSGGDAATLLTTIRAIDSDGCNK